MRSSTTTTGQALAAALHDEQAAKDELQRAFRQLERAAARARQMRVVVLQARDAHERTDRREGVEQFGAVA